MNTRRVAAVITVLVTLAALYPLVSHDFTTWDDPHNIVKNPNLNPPSFAGLKDHWSRAWAGLYIPVTYTVWALLANVAQVSDENGPTLNPWVFHGFNLLVHVGSALVVLNILRRLRFDTSAACFGAIVFAVHPVQVESVGWVSGLKDVLCGFLSLVAIQQYIAAIGDDRAQFSRRHFAVAIVAFVLALLSKPSAVALPLVLASIDAVLLRRPMRQVARSAAVFLVIAIPFIVMGKIFQPATLNTPVPLWWRPFVAGEAVAFYLCKIVWPAQLGIDYGHSPRYVMHSGIGYYAWLLPCAIGIALIVSSRRCRVQETSVARNLAAAACVFAAALLPVLGFVRFDFQEKSSVADHYLYLSMLGVAIACATLFCKFSRNRTIVAATTIVVLALCIRSNVQSRVWRDSRTLYLHTAAVNPRSALAFNNLFVVAMDQRDGEQAERAARRLLEIQPDEMLSHTNLGGALALQDRYTEAANVYRAAGERWPDKADPHVGLALALTDMGRPRDALPHFDLAARVDPNYPELHKLRARAEQAAIRAATSPSASPP